MLSELSADGVSGKLDARRTDALVLADRVEALKRVERSLLNCKRLGDPELLQAKLAPTNSPRGVSVSFVDAPALRDFFPFAAHAWRIYVMLSSMVYLEA